MKTWSQCCDEAGYDPKMTCPIREYVWYAYSNGNAASFKTEAEAKSFSKNIEKVVTPASKKEFDDHYAQQSALEVKANDIWYDAFRDEFNFLNQKTFTLCEEEAWSRGHASGRDEVYSYMLSIVDFAERIINENRT